MKKKIVFLFGAGAVLDWGGPKTLCSRNQLTMLPEHGEAHIIKNRVCCLTHLIRETGYKAKNGQRITELIYNHLKSANTLSVPNFEHILHEIEELFNVFCIANHRNEYDRSPWHLEIKEQIDFTVNEINEKTGTYSFAIPGYEDFKESFVTALVSPEEVYFQKLYHDQIGGIVGHVSKYAFHTDRHSKVFRSVNESINHNFINWIKCFAEISSLRMYTLNYDCIFSLLLNSQGIEVFEGFYKDDSNAVYSEMSADVSTILTDFVGNIFYNLHGGSNWHVKDFEEKDLLGYEYFSTPTPNIENLTSTVEIERGKKLLVSNIISGFQKVQKTFLTPFRQMLAALDRDCIEAEEFYIVGYSFGDEHINDIIRNARKYNEKMHITLINPVFDDLHFLTNFLLHWGDLTFKPLRNEGELIVSDAYKVKIIRSTFGDFLSNPKHLPKS